MNRYFKFTQRCLINIIYLTRVKYASSFFHITMNLWFTPRPVWSPDCHYKILSWPVKVQLEETSKLLTVGATSPVKHRHWLNQLVAGDCFIAWQCCLTFYDTECSSALICSCPVSWKKWWMFPSVTTKLGAEKERVETLYCHLSDVESPCSLFVLWTLQFQAVRFLRKELKSFLTKQKSAWVQKIKTSEYSSGQYSRAVWSWNTWTWSRPQHSLVSIICLWTDWVTTHELRENMNSRDKTGWKEIKWSFIISHKHKQSCLSRRKCQNRTIQMFLLIQKQHL